MANKRMTLGEKFKELTHIPTWLFILLIVVLILRIPSFFEPYSYGDEMIYLSLGEGVRNNLTLYKDIHDNKPPLLYLVAAIAGNLFWFKAILAIWHLLTITVFWFFVKKIFKSNGKISVFATTLFAISTTIPLFEGNIANAELFMIGPTILGFYLLYPKGKKVDIPNIYAIAAGISFSIASLFKVPAAFDMAAIFFLWLVYYPLERRTILKLLKKGGLVIIGFITPIAISLLWYGGQGVLNEYISAAYLQNVGYLSSWRPSDVEKSFIDRNFPLLSRFTVVFASYIVLFIQRKKLSHQFIFVTAWLLAALFAVTLSERPYPHYFVQALPAVSILIAMFFALETIEQAYVVLPLTIAFLVPVYFKFWHYETLSYYQRFFGFVSGSYTKEEYLNSFGQETYRNYKVSEYIRSNTKPNDKVFVSGNSSTIYALSKRLPPIKFVADYHISDFAPQGYVIRSLIDNPPSYIVILPDSRETIELRSLLISDYYLADEIDGAEIWKLLSPKLRDLK